MSPVFSIASRGDFIQENAVMQQMENAQYWKVVANLEMQIEVPLQFILANVSSSWETHLQLIDKTNLLKSIVHF